MSPILPRTLTSFWNKWLTVLMRYWSLPALTVSLYLLAKSRGRPESGGLTDLLLAISVALMVHILERFQLWRDIEGLFERTSRKTAEDFNDLLQSAGALGLVKIYLDRRDQKLKDALRMAIKSASKELWLLGIAFREQIVLDDVLSELEDNPNRKDLDLRILMMDSLRSPGVFRTLLEIKLDRVGTIVKEGANGEATELLAQKMYSDSEATYNTLFANREQFESSVKYYAHNPNCWLILADEEVFFQPYTFGKPQRKGRDVTMTLGPHMPIFRFQKLEAGGGPYEILRDHFDKLWRTSNIGLVHFGASLGDKEQTAGRILKNRSRWFNFVYEGLGFKGDKRKHQRRRCDEDWSVEANWTKGNGSTEVLRGTVFDSSRNGISLNLQLPTGVSPVRGERIKITSQQPKGAYPAWSKLGETLITPFTDLPLFVAWPDPKNARKDRPNCVGLSRREL
jgi:hypothetical protein